MLHTQIKDEEVVERYVRNRLTVEKRRAFEEHFFECDECFAKVQETERFVAGVWDAAEHGVLGYPEETFSGVRAAGWVVWAFSISTAIAILLAITLGWITLRTLPDMRASLNSTATTVQSQQRVIASLKESPAETPEANVPFVMVQASRGDEGVEAVIPQHGKRLVLWIELGPTRFSSYRMEVFAESGARVATVENLLRGPYGAVSASLPADQLHPGILRITLAGQTPSPASLVGEYRLRLRKP